MAGMIRYRGLRRGVFLWNSTERPRCSYDEMAIGAIGVASDVEIGGESFDGV